MQKLNKDEKNYKKESGKILQYFHKIKEIENLTNLKLIDKKSLVFKSKN